MLYLRKILKHIFKENAEFVKILDYKKILNCKIFLMNRIKEVLEEKGIKQTWLAEKLGKSYNMVNSYVQNRQQPRLEVLNEIAIILDVDVRELLTSSKG